MKLYSKYKTAIANIGNINKAYFTTFNLSVEFFETYILPPLLGIDIPDNNFQYEDINVKLGEIEKNREIDIKVFYDANMLQLNEQKRTIQKFIPILMDKGLFHPKVIYLENIDGNGKLFVGSGNLTLNGWGRNTEAFDILDVKSGSNLANQVYDFFDDINILAKHRQKKINRDISFDSSVNFIHSFRINEKSNFLDALSLSNNLTVWSPYFSDKMDTLLKKEEFKSIENINILPDFVGEDKKIRVAKLPKDKRIKFNELKGFESTSMNHSKIWISNNKIAIGSYNFTNEALYGTNFECSIVKDIDNISLDFEECLPNYMDESQLKQESLKTITSFKYIFDLTVDWSNRNISLQQISGKVIDKCKVILSSNLEINYLDNELSILNSIEEEKFFRILTKNRNFKIKKGKDIIFEGFITEIGTKGYREPIKVETIDDIFSSFLDERNPTSAKILKSKSIDFDGGNEDTIESRINGNSSNLNYYNLFKGFSNLTKKLEVITSRRDFIHYCFNASNSISSIILIIDEYKKEHKNLFTYLFIKEFNMLIKKVNKKIKKEYKDIKEFQSLENIFKLKKSDAKFLEKFYDN